MNNMKLALNRLANEQSPYLLQHANNPVSWYPWGQEAFEKAKSEDKPVFLSIGYSTCHWCHVMAHESFEDDNVAESLNRDFVSIKVDREERPDIDAVYMSVCHALTGSGGWPLTIIMTPDQKPFFAATYLPRHSRYGMMGLTELLEEVSRLWKSDRAAAVNAGNEITEHLESRNPVTHSQPDTQLLTNAFQLYVQNFDQTRGGFGPAPKFPAPHNLLFLLRYSKAAKNTKAYEMAEKTLIQMYRGGIFDHIGGGFSRYSTDEKWLVPHFEKMLYDNGLLAYVYAEIYQQSKDPFYREITEKILYYVERELTDDSGGFYCGQDADSDGVEGKYYVFTPNEIEKVLGSDQSQDFCQWFDITGKGNFEGKSIPNLLKNEKFRECPPSIEAMCHTLFDYRKKRTALHKDDKILTSWNGLMIAALAKAGRLFSSEKLIQQAQDAQSFIARHLTDADGSLLVRWRNGDAAHKGQLDDYAFYAFSLLELYQATFDVQYIKEAISMAKKMTHQFFDEKEGGFYLYGTDSEQLISRPKESYDGAMPSGNSVAALVMNQLFLLTGDLSWKDKADLQFQYLAGIAKAYPPGYGFALTAMAEIIFPSAQLICVSSLPGCPDELKAFLTNMNISNISVIVKDPVNEKVLAETAPHTAEYPLPEKGVLYYLCTNGACQTPVSSIEMLKAAIEKTI